MRERRAPGTSERGQRGDEERASQRDESGCAASWRASLQTIAVRRRIRRPGIAEWTDDQHPRRSHDADRVPRARSRRVSAGRLQHRAARDRAAPGVRHRRAWSAPSSWPSCWSPSTRRRSRGRWSSSRCGARSISLEQARRKFCAGFAYAGIRSVERLGRHGIGRRRGRSGRRPAGRPRRWSPTAASSPSRDRRRPSSCSRSEGGTIVPDRPDRGPRRPTDPEVTRAHHRPRGRLQRPAPANGLRVIVAEDHLAPVVAVNLWYDVGSKHEVTGQDRLRPPVRARHVPGLAPRRQGRAHRPRPGGRRDDERLDLARPDELLRDAAGPPARARAVARGRPDGDPARRAQPGEPRQPARGRQEREALVVRQPAVRLVPGEAPGPPLPAGASVPPLDDRLDGRPRRGLARGRQRLLPDLLRAEQRGPVGRRRRRDGRRAGRRRALLRRDPGQPGHPAHWATCRCRRPSAGSGARPSSTGCRCRASTSASGRRSSATRALDALDLAGQILSGGKGSRLNRRLVRDERIAQDVALFTLGFIGGALDHGRLGDRPAGRLGRPRRGGAASRSSNGSRRSS